MRSDTRTIVFTDMRGSTAQRVRLGDDAFDAVRHEHDRVVAATVVQHGGEVVKSTGDGVMAAFGSASDALAGAVAVQQAIDRLNHDGTTDEPVGIGIGISAGDVVAEVGDLHGTSVIEAARLCAVAAAGQILVSEVVCLLARTRGEHDLAPMGPLDLRGLATPVSTWELHWCPVRGPGVPLPPRLVPGPVGFVGRDDECERLLGALQHAGTGRCGLAFIVGEPGIGKTRLATEVAVAAHRDGAIVLAGACDEDLGGPFQPWLGALGHLVAHVSDQVLDAHLADHGGELERIVPELRRRRPDLAVSTVHADGLDRHRMFEAIAHLLAGAADAAPLVVVLDDLHWADTASLQLMRHLVRLARPAPILVIGTYRDTDLDHTGPLAAALADLRRDHLFERIALDGLREPDLAELVAQRAGQRASAELVRSLSAETDGNPFFVGELLTHIIETGAIVSGGRGWDTAVPIDELGVPGGVREVIERRMARLSASANDVLSVASVIGRKFDLATLAAVGPFPVDELIDVLDAAVRAGLVIEDPTRADQYKFAHELIRRTLYGRHASARRVRMHWRIGEALAIQGRGDADAIAFHLAAGMIAGDVASAVDAALAAGARALEMAAFERAADQFSLAGAMLDDSGRDDPERRYAALAGLGDALVALSDVPGYIDAWIGAASVARAHGWHDRLARAALGIGSHALILRLTPEVATLFDEAIDVIGPDDSIERSLLLSHRAYHRSITPGVADDRRADLDEAEAIAARLGSPRATAQARFVRAAGMRGSPAADQIAALAARLLDDARALDHVMLQTHALLLLGTARLQMGDRPGWDEARAELVTLADRPSATYAQAQTLLWENVALVADGRFDQARTGARQGARDSVAFPIVETSFRSQSVLLAAWFGDDGEAVSTLRSWVDIPGIAVVSRLLLASLLIDEEPTHARVELDAMSDDGFAIVGKQVAQRPWVLERLADLCARTGAVRHAPTLERLLSPYAGQVLLAPSAFFVLSATDVARARLVAMQGRHDEADALFERGIALEDAVGAGLGGTISRLWRSEHLAARGRPGDLERVVAMAEGCRAALASSGCVLAHRADRLCRSLVLQG